MSRWRSEKRRIPSGLWIRVSLLIALVLTGIALVRFTPVGDYLTDEHLLALIETLRSTWWTPFLLIGLFAVVSVLGLPPVPLLVGGAAFGVLCGSMYNIMGLLIGAFLAYWVARILGRDFVVRITGDRLRRAENIFERHGFWPLVQTRFMPLPFAVVNFGAALAGVRPIFFLTSSMAGLIPSTLIHTYFIARAMATHGRARALTLALYAGAMVLFNILLSALWIQDARQRRKRYLRLVALRAARQGRDGPVREAEQNPPRRLAR